MPALDTLPLEILFKIFDFTSNPYNASSSALHPLNSLAATNKHLDSAVEEHTRALLKQHAQYAPLKKSKTYTSRRKWLAETCQLCYKKSKRRSTLWTNMTCCLACDKKTFPKMTMTNAIKQHNLSKLDIFTPNRLHPTLPTLAHGEYTVMGGVATMIYEPELAARRDLIHGCLTDSDRFETNLRKRIRRHDALIMHLEIRYTTRNKRWYESSRRQADYEGKSIRASLLTRESRDEFVRNALKQERAAMRMECASQETAIALN